jgi:PTH1 family peptidyl-tRNA hydrolase
LRIRPKGSAGGHNGIKSILQHLGHDVFKRVKVGVGEKPKGWDLADHVLSRFTTEERKSVDEAVKVAVEAVELLVTFGTDEAMNKCNRSGK